MFVTSKKYRQLLQERNDLFDEVSCLRRENKTLLKNPFGFENITVCNKFTLPMLTDGEAEVLESCLFSYNQGFDITPSVLRTPQFLKKLTDKGYLRRVKRGQYQLTFIKYDD